MDGFPASKPPSVDPAASAISRRTRTLEALALLGLVPPVWALWLPGRFVLPLVWVAAAICTVGLMLDRGFDHRVWLRGAGGWTEWRAMLGRFAAAAGALGLLLVVGYPAALFQLPLERPRIWGMLMLLYPVLSVYPQGVIYRAFFHRRYGDLFPARVEPWIAAAAFGWAHIVFGNLWAVAFTFVGGVMFYRTYLRTRSLLVAAVEQSLYGLWLFTVGWGHFLYHGTARLAETV
jgi:uncharacterized protein